MKRAGFQPRKRKNELLLTMQVLARWRRMQTVALLCGHVDYVLLAFTADPCLYARSIAAAAALMLGRSTYRAFALVGHRDHARVAAGADFVSRPGASLG